jgi:hypothetical protein
MWHSAMKTEPSPLSPSGSVPEPFACFPHSPAAHFHFVYYGAVLRLLRRAMDRLPSAEEAYEQFPFLIEYNNELADFGLQGMNLEQAVGWWDESLAAWERNASVRLPLLELCRAAGLGGDSLVLWITVGLIEEDARWGRVFEMLHGAGAQPRPTLGLLQSWRRDDAAFVRRTLDRLQGCGLVEVVNPESPHPEWAYQIPGLIWNALRGEDENAGESLRLNGWLAYDGPGRIDALDKLILPEELAGKVERLPALLASGEVGAVIVRGPLNNGRKTLLGGLGRALGMGRLEIRAAVQNGLVVPRGSDPRGTGWQALGPLATLRQALPVISLDLPPGEKAELPALSAYRGPIGLALGSDGSVGGDPVERAVTICLEMPSPGERRRHWAACAGNLPADDLDVFAERFRLTGGNIRRVSALARSIAALDQRGHFGLGDVQQASRALNRQALETLAHRLEPLSEGRSGWNLLTVDGHTQEELNTLESRCRCRERLPGSVGPAVGRQLNSGVRALFSGPSGTGKTLAARVLAGVLQKDLYRLDLSAVVNKYIGETEKNLSQAFDRAEELDVVLLIDEGDALLTQRTAVNTSNDRYANLETNYLLQRVESFQGLLIVTTNAAGRIDGAFLRRMDVVVEFHAPEPEERYAIWQMHLPAGHALDPEFLQEAAVRCALTGGQIRNAALHAVLLALQDGGVVTDGHLFAAVEREYRKRNALCPLSHPGTED